jgi:hypothetical protein
VLTKRGDHADRSALGQGGGASSVLPTAGEHEPAPYVLPRNRNSPPLMSTP